MTEEVVAYLADWFDSMETMPAYGVDPTPEELAQFRSPPPEQGQPLEDVLGTLSEAGRGGIYHPSGGHMSYIPNSGMYTAALGDFMEN